MKSDGQNFWLEIQALVHAVGIIIEQNSDWEFRWIDRHVFQPRLLQTKPYPYIRSLQESPVSLQRALGETHFRSCRLCLAIAYVRECGRLHWKADGGKVVYSSSSCHTGYAFTFMVCYTQFVAFPDVWETRIKTTEQDKYQVPNLINVLNWTTCHTGKDWMLAPFSTSMKFGPGELPLNLRRLTF